MNCYTVAFLFIGSALAVAIPIMRACAQFDAIDQKMREDLRCGPDTFPPHSPNPAAESIQDPAGPSSEKAAPLPNR